MAEDEEEDYMSDNFLSQTESVRPGLAWGKLSKRNEQEKKHKAASVKNKFKPLKQREQEEREKGLKNALTSDNKGFAMLQKMGYKKGMGLGKQGTGRAEPVPIEVKADRGGLGRVAEMKRKQQIRERLEVEAMRKRQKLMGQLKGDFRQRMKSKFEDKLVWKDLHNSQKTCHYLDGVEGIDMPTVSWYWPPKPVEKKLEDDEEQTDQSEAGSHDKEEDIEEEEEEEEEEEKEKEEEELDTAEEPSPQEMLQELTKYLRMTYYYCVWCGTSFADTEDLSANCPGDTWDDHN
ncbi:G patch domain-containing protein 11-like isoform X2 [Apostichopus japonicus]|uniref:G patch domain-containing protein 11-like isoform X2 n=1 Tax=Stichopus japonicus TaxID=307972 RepID=UPI003AB50705